MKGGCYRKPKTGKEHVQQRGTQSTSISRGCCKPSALFTGASASPAPEAVTQPAQSAPASGLPGGIALSLLWAFKEQVVFYYLNNCLFAIETLLSRHGSLWMCFSLWASRELHFTLNKELLRIFSGFFSRIKWIQIIEKIKCSTINISNVSSTAYIYRFSLQKKYFH